jgi:ABC-type multidrug transport system permease subunit
MEVFMSSLMTTLGGYASYRGREGHWAFLLHRITGLGVVLFLAIHILDTSMVYFAPHLYDEAINIYRSTVFGILEIVLVFCLIFMGRMVCASPPGLVGANIGNPESRRSPLCAGSGPGHLGSIHRCHAV